MNKIRPLERTILHCDCNSFFASVELLQRPELQKQPVAVCGDPKQRRGVILAKNEPAKALGIITGEAVWNALKKCPGLVLLPPHHGLYVEYSKKINLIYERFTSQVEPFGIDESWLDVTQSIHLFGSGRSIADQIRQIVKKELGLTLSIGVSFNKIFAKLGSDYKKPDATTVISPDNYQEILYPLPVRAMLYVGEAAAERLGRIGIRTIGDLAAVSPETLVSMLGRQGLQLHAYAHGQDDSPVARIVDHHESKSIGKGMTFSHDLPSLPAVRSHVLWLADQVAGQLRAADLKCLSVQVAIKNPQLKTITRQKTLTRPTALARVLYETAIELIQSNWSFRIPIRMLSLTAQHLCPADQAHTQISLLDQDNDLLDRRQAKLESSIDDIRQRFGGHTITFGRLIKDPDDPEN